MTNLGYATVTLMPSMKGFGKAMDAEVGRSSAAAGASGGKKAGGSFLKTFGGGVLKVSALATGVVGAVGTAIAGASLKKGLDRALDIQDAQKKLEGLGHSQAGIAKIMGNALDSVRGTAFGLGDAATISASAVAAGIKPGKELTAYLKLTADTATIAGTSLADMGSIMNKAHTGTAVYSDTLNQLSDRGIPVFQYLQEEYGVTAEKLTEMVRKGEVDSAHLDAALTKNLAGSALRSGETARGAWANVGAALGRLGVAFTGGAVAQAPALFTSMGGAIDRLTVAIKPFADEVSGRLVAGMQSLGKWIDGLDFQRIADGIGAVYALVVGGDFTGKFREIFGQDEDSTTVAVILGIRNALVSLGKAIGGLFQGKGLDLGPFTSSLGEARTVLQPMWPLFVQFAKAVGGLAGNLGGLLAPAIGILNPLLGVLRDVLQFVADHMDTVIAFLPVIAAGFVLWRTSTTAVAAANRILTAAEIAALPVRLANNALRIAAANAELRVALANGASTQSLLLNSAALGRNAVAAVAQRVATTAMSVASKAAAAGQWLLNAAMSANPIGLVVAAIAALVAGLVWFFTQTELGRTIWANFTKFLGEAWANISRVATTVFKAVADFFVKTWQGIVLAVTIAVEMLKANIAARIALIANVIRVYVNTWKAIFTAVWSAIKAVVSAGIAVVKTVISTALALIKAIFSGNWGAIPGIISGAVGKIGGIVRGLATTLLGVLKKLAGDVLKPFGDVGSKLLQIGKDLVQGLINGISGAANGVITAARNLANLLPEWVRKVLDIHSPSRVFRAIGQFVGKGLALGVDDSAEGVKKRMDDLATLVTDSFSKLKDEATKAQKDWKKATKSLKDDTADLAILRRRLADVNPKGRTADTQRASITKAIKEKQAEIRADKKAAKAAQALAKLDSAAYAKAVAKYGKDGKTLLNRIKSTGVELEALGEQREAIAADLKKANDDLAEAVKIRDDFAKNVMDAVVNLGDVTDAFSKAVDAREKAAEKVADLTKSLADLDKENSGLGGDRQTILDKISAAMTVSATSASASRRAQALKDIEDLNGDLADLDGKVSDYTTKRADLLSQISEQTAASNASATDAITANLRQQIADAKAFNGALATLRSQGLDDTTYKQIIAKGVDGGGLATAQALLGAGPGLVSEIAALQGELADAAGVLGTTTAGSLYQAGVDAAQGIVDGLKSQQAALQEQMETLADSLVTAIEKRLDIHSPSRVLAKRGVFAGQGLAMGVSSTLGLVTAAGTSLADALDVAPVIPSPSFDESVASRYGLGGDNSVHLNYTQQGGNGLTGEQELSRAASRLKRAIRK